MRKPPNYCKGERRSMLLGKGLTEADVRAIREDPRKLPEIGRAYGISAPMVHFIKKRKRWASVK